MTVHASIELLEAMKGVAPMREFDRGASDVQACSGWRGQVAWAFIGITESVETPEVVDCRLCLRFMFDIIATDPMRLDTLLERGDLKPLEPEARGA